MAFCNISRLSERHLFGSRSTTPKRRDYIGPNDSVSSLFIYIRYPTCSLKFIIESKFTKVYFYIDEVGGWEFYVAYFLVYLALVELGVYWMHRTLHTNKFLYKNVHGLHHKYNQAVTLTPWASIAFNPLDGILQASPYVVFLFFVPVHYFTHVFMLFFSGVWATNIHDAVWGNYEPIMGAKYHTVHHTHFHYNFGQFFVVCDKVFGTFREPDPTVPYNPNKLTASKF